ncbi:MAG: hypothetical protein ACP5H2_08580 [Solirubrobacteraceae bacterium]
MTGDGGAADSVAAVVTAVRGWQTSSGRQLVVAIDGHGAAGKTTIANLAAGELEAILLHTDSYFRDAGPTAPPVPMARYYDWERLRTEALIPALSKAGRAPLLIEGVSSASPALADLVTRRILVWTAEPVRLERLRARISEEEWDETWLAQERLYFATVPPESFDLVVPGG